MLCHLVLRGYFAVNSYLFFDDTRHALLIDPGAEPEKVLHALSKYALTLDAILLTHGHIDHLGACNALRSALGVPIAMAEKGRAYAENPYLNLSEACGEPITVPDIDYFDPEQNPIFKLGSKRLRVVAVPGHTPDSVIYLDDEGSAFVGDTIIEGGPGLTHFPGGNARKLKESIVRHILTLPPETILYSGHSEPICVRELRI